MAILYRLSLILLLGAYFEPPQKGTDAKPAQPGKNETPAAKKDNADKRRKDDELGKYDLEFLLSEPGPKEQNGVKVTIKAERTVNDDVDRIRVDWLMNYKGPRPPLIIRRPSLTEGVYPRETDLMVFAVGKSHQAYGYGYANPVRIFMPVPWVTSKKWFMTVREGGEGGELVLETANIRRYLRARKPDEFDPAVPPKLYLKLYLHPQDRGAEHGIDAWTGEVESNIFELDLKSW